MILNLHAFIETSEVRFEHFISFFVFSKMFNMLILIHISMYSLNVQDCVVKLLYHYLNHDILLFEQSNNIKVL